MANEPKESSLADEQGPTREAESGTRLKKMLSLEWAGQMAASLCWIASVFVYGITSTGDWLQLGAASAWFVANLAALNREGK